MARVPRERYAGRHPPTLIMINEAAEPAYEDADLPSSPGMFTRLLDGPGGANAVRIDRYRSCARHLPAGPAPLAASRRRADSRVGARSGCRMAGSCRSVARAGARAFAVAGRAVAESPADRRVHAARPSWSCIHPRTPRWRLDVHVLRLHPLPGHLPDHARHAAPGRARPRRAHLRPAPARAGLGRPGPRHRRASRALRVVVRAGVPRGDRERRRALESGPGGRCGVLPRRPGTRRLVLRRPHRVDHADRPARTSRRPVRHAARRRRNRHPVPSR